jgi:hypothetical protein
MLGRSGLTPMDTTLTIASNVGRVVVLRHPPPDNAIFAMLDIPGDSAATDSIRIELLPVPGSYGVNIQATPRLPVGMRLTFSYAVHFQAPSDAITGYISATRYEQALGVGRVEPDNRLRFVAGDRPAADMLRVPVTGAGVYHVAAPK